MLKIEKLSKSYGKKQVLNSVNLNLETGKVYGIVGQNGAGKTTLFRCISGLENYEGEIKSELHPLKDHLGLLFTDPYFFSKITGKEYIQLLLQGRKVKCNDIEQNNIFDLPLNQYAESYSTGMKKKLALTAILLQENDFFILDEPFNGVDIQSNFMIVEVIKKIKNSGKTILMSSHIFSTLKEVCDEIHVLEKGTFVKSYEKNEFSLLEKEMNSFVFGNKLDSLKF
ncbi:ATP-binding cassette domain-containing protein [Wenyingzhuangia sp. 2_MG-2023]|uniref:ABC transporter ATP-binding protein n=1 Tax=Wenyingzhuangia sp. 2_MG-2023 TaxID=3062639 RepID=UPI0026E2A663|nr:ATP-binding cassette domain-containing protein [Wenyingzhuangia sp. 2_MG-2023]MDO6737909.1 ATP-binding cassette domain-containing protein [Wenyingzhuangia sp. 2_MG-2023]